MKQKRTKPRPTPPKGKRWPSTSEEWHKYAEECAIAEYLDYLHDVAQGKFKKSDKYKQAQELLDKYKKRAKK